MTNIIISISWYFTFIITYEMKYTNVKIQMNSNKKATLLQTPFLQTIRLNG